MNSLPSNGNTLQPPKLSDSIDISHDMKFKDSIQVMDLRGDIRGKNRSMQRGDERDMDEIKTPSTSRRDITPNHASGHETDPMKSMIGKDISINPSNIDLFPRKDNQSIKVLPSSPSRYYSQTAAAENDFGVSDESLLQEDSPLMIPRGQGSHSNGPIPSKQSGNRLFNQLSMR